MVIYPKQRNHQGNRIWNFVEPGVTLPHLMWSEALRSGGAAHAPTYKRQSKNRPQNAARALFCGLFLLWRLYVGACAAPPLRKASLHIRWGSVTPGSRKLQMRLAGGCRPG